MPRGPELSSEMRSRICELHAFGLSYARIARVHPEIKKSTIAYTYQQENRRKNNQSRP
jgi:hypothetical protein